MAFADFSTEEVDAAQTASNYSVDACPGKDRAANAIGLKKKVQIELDNEFGNDWYGNSRASAKLFRGCSSKRGTDAQLTRSCNVAQKVGGKDDFIESDPTYSCQQ